MCNTGRVLRIPSPAVQTHGHPARCAHTSVIEPLVGSAVPSTGVMWETLCKTLSLLFALFLALPSALCFGFVGTKVDIV